MSRMDSQTGSVGQGSDRIVLNDVHARTTPVSDETQTPPPWNPTCTVTHSRPSVGWSQRTQAPTSPLQPTGRSAAEVDGRAARAAPASSRETRRVRIGFTGPGGRAPSRQLRLRP